MKVAEYETHKYVGISTFGVQHLVNGQNKIYMKFSLNLIA